MNTLSVILISYNAAKTLAQCLDSVRWAHEIIVLDAHSTDDTLAIAQRYTPQVYSADWEGFGKQKNKALDKATQEWVLSLDSDEVITPELAAEIQQVLNANSEYQAYYLPRHSYFCNRLIRHGDWGKDRVLRLFKRGSGRFDNAPVHEKLILEGPTTVLKNPMLHYTAPSLTQVLEKMNRYSSLGAEKKLAAGKTSSLRQALLHGLWAFVRCYILRAGFLDGRAGFVLAVTVAEGTYYRYLKMIGSL